MPTVSLVMVPRPWSNLASLPVYLLLFTLAAADHYWIMCVAMVIIGSTNNLWHPAAISYLSARFPDRKGYALSIHALGGNTSFDR